MVCIGKRAGMCCIFGDFGCSFVMWEWCWLGCVLLGWLGFGGLGELLRKCGVEE